MHKCTLHIFTLLKTDIQLYQYQEKFEYIKVVIRSRKSNDRQYNGQTKKYKGINNY